jgi:hypothetical protein
MSHYHLEIIMPPTEDVEKAVEQILAQFDENAEGEDADTRSAFWDFWVIGGRWAGAKMQAAVGQDKIDAFYEWAKKQKIMVSRLQFGKQNIPDANQRAMVDAKWSELCPDFRGPCPMFQHANDQYSSDSVLPLDVCRLDQMPTGLTASRVIIAGPRFRKPTEREAAYMLTSSIWNGCTWQDTKWDGLVSSAIAQHQEQERRDEHKPAADWLVVTVDYHS